jgi:hypothetical protein
MDTSDRIDDPGARGAAVRGTEREGLGAGRGEPSRAGAHGFLSSATLGLCRPIRSGSGALPRVRSRQLY